MILTLIQGLIFVTYVIFIWIKFKGPLSSISESWYKLGEPLNVLFTLFCFSIGIMMPFHIVGTVPIFFFLSGAGLCFTGAAAMFKDDNITSIVHMIGATICVIGGLLGIGVELGHWIPTIIFIISASLLRLLKVKNNIWWIEIVAFACILSGLLIYE
jgi:hypothetical protein